MEKLTQYLSESRTLLFLGALISTVTLVSGVFEKLNNSYFQWAGLGIAGMLFLAYGFRPHDAQVDFTPDGRIKRKTPIGRIAFGLAGALLLGYDAVTIYQYSNALPLRVAIESFVNGSDRVVTAGGESNPLFMANVAAIYPIAETIKMEGDHFPGLICENAVGRASTRSVALTRYCIEVTNFRKIPNCWQRGMSRGAAEAIEAAFMLRRQNDKPFPWTFDSEQVLVKTSQAAKPLTTPYNMPANDIVALRYFVSAKNPGIYWVQSVVYVVVEGATKPIRVPLHPKPIPIAFYASEGPFPTNADGMVVFPNAK